MSNHLHSIGAALCGIAIQKLFPKETYFGSSVSERGFVCSFSYREPFQDSFLPLLEKKLGELEEPILLEMIGGAAAELLEHLNLPRLAEQAGKQDLIQIARFGDCAEIFSGKWVKTLFTTLYAFEQKKGRVHILGAAFESQKRLREFEKLRRSYSQQRHEVLAKELDLYEGEFWHPRGISLRQILLTYWYQCCQDAGYEEVEIPIEKAASYAKETGRKKICCWNGTEDIFFNFEEKGDQVLPWIKKSIKIFTFEHQGLLIRDGLGFFVRATEIEEKKGVVRFSLYGDIKKWIALLLEHTKGELPFWLCPEQVRILAFDQVDVSQVIEIFRRLEIRFTVDSTGVPLGEKVHRALRIKVPYVIVFGKREESAGQVTMRTYGSKRDIPMKYEELEKFFRERKRKFESE